MPILHTLYSILPFSSVPPALPPTNKSLPHPCPYPYSAMPLYGTALLAVCHLLGILLGELLGRALGVQANVGGVGIAMLLLMAARYHGHRRGWLEAKSEEGVHYWAALYIPVVIAMSMQQNVVKALSGGPMALAAAITAGAACAGCVSLINRREVVAPAETSAE